MAWRCRDSCKYFCNSLKEVMRDQPISSSSLPGGEILTARKACPVPSLPLPPRFPENAHSQYSYTHTQHREACEGSRTATMVLREINSEVAYEPQQQNNNNELKNTLTSQASFFSRGGFLSKQSWLDWVIFSPFFPWEFFPPLQA